MNESDKMLVFVFALIVVAVVVVSVVSFGAASPSTGGTIAAQAPSFSSGVIGGGCGV